MTRSARWVAATFDRRAPSYDQSTMHRWQAEQAVDFLAPARDQRILDVATGTGLVARAAAARLGLSGAVVGVDISAGMLRQAQQAPGERRCWFVRADAAAAPFPAEVFDAVLCVAAVPYFSDLVLALREWRRVCRPQAQAVVTVPAAVRPRARSHPVAFRRHREISMAARIRVYLRGTRPEFRSDL